MPLILSTNEIISKNKLTSSDVDLLLLKFEYKQEIPVNVCLNNTEISWNNEIWYPAAFSLTGLEETKESTIPSVNLTFTDIERRIIPEIESFDGCIGGTVTLYIVNSSLLSNLTPSLQETLTILGTTVDDNLNVTFTLGTENLFYLRLPVNRYIKNQCRFKFKDSLCQYSGSETDCNGTYARCQELGNSNRYGGFISMGAKGVVA